jgi:PleD family two-component response regulator
LGEDTFALLLPGVQLPDAAVLANRLRLAVERCRLPRRAGALFFTISVGAIEASEGDDMRKMLERSRAALQAAVNQGRNATCAHDVLGQLVPPAAAWAAKS